MRTLQIKLGDNIEQHNNILNAIKDAQILALFNHPAIIELQEENKEIAAMKLIYLEAKTAQININSISD